MNTGRNAHRAEAYASSTPAMEEPKPHAAHVEGGASTAESVVAVAARPTQIPRRMGQARREAGSARERTRLGALPQVRQAGEAQGGADGFHPQALVVRQDGAAGHALARAAPRRRPSRGGGRAAQAAEGDAAARRRRARAVCGESVRRQCVVCPVTRGALRQNTSRVMEARTGPACGAAAGRRVRVPAGRRACTSGYRCFTARRRSRRSSTSSPALVAYSMPTCVRAVLFLWGRWRARRHIIAQLIAGVRGI